MKRYQWNPSRRDWRWWQIGQYYTCNAPRLHLTFVSDPKEVYLPANIGEVAKIAIACFSMFLPIRLSARATVLQRYPYAKMESNPSFNTIKLS